MYVKECGLHNQNIDMIILFACFVGWFDSSFLEIWIWIKAQSLILGLCLGWREYLHGPHNLITWACTLMRVTILGTLCRRLYSIQFYRTNRISQLIIVQLDLMKIKCSKSKPSFTLSMKYFRSLKVHIS